MELHALGLAELVAGGLDGDVWEVAGHELQQQRPRSQRHTGMVARNAFDHLLQHRRGGMTCVELTAEYAGDAERPHDYDHQNDRQRVTEDAHSTLIWPGLTSRILCWSAAQSMHLASFLG